MDLYLLSVFILKNICFSYRNCFSKVSFCHG